MLKGADCSTEKLWKFNWCDWKDSKLNRTFKCFENLGISLNAAQSIDSSAHESGLQTAGVQVGSTYQDQFYLQICRI